MKILIIGELNENSLSSNTMEMIGKANELSTDVFVTTIGSVDSPNANVENTTSNYIKVNENVLSPLLQFPPYVYISYIKPPSQLPP